MDENKQENQETASPPVAKKRKVKEDKNQICLEPVNQSIKDTAAAGAHHISQTNYSPDTSRNARLPSEGLSDMAHTRQAPESGNENMPSSSGLAAAETNVISGDSSRVDISQSKITLNSSNTAGDVNIVKGHGAKIKMKQCTIVIKNNQVVPTSYDDSADIARREGSGFESFITTCNEEIESVWRGHLDVAKDYGDLINEPENESSSNFKINRKFFEGDLETKSIQLKKGKANTFERPAEACEESFKYETLKKTILDAKENRLSIIGTAGAGKSVLTRRLLRDLSQSDGRPRLIVFNNFRDFPETEEISPLQLLFGGLFEDESIARIGYDWLLKNQENAFFIFDGLDQVSWSVKTNSKLIRPYGKGKTSDIVSNIFSGKLLPNVKVVYTSREHSVAALEGKCRPGMVIMMTGLSEADIKSLFISLVGNSGEDIWNKLAAQSYSLITLLSTPVFLIFAAIVYKTNSSKPPEFVTSLMLEILELFKWSSHITQRDIPKVIKGLEEMSYNGLLEKIVLFMIGHIKAAGLNIEEIRDWMVDFPGKKRLNQFLLEGHHAVFFSHQSLQEILGASHLSKLDLLEFTRVVREYLSDDYWSLVLRFVSGILLNKETEGYGPEISNKNEKRKVLKEMLAYKYKNAENTTEMLSVLAAISESGDKEFIRSMVSRINIISYPINGTGAHVISSILLQCHSLEELTLQGCSFDDTTGSIMWQTVKDRDIQVKELNLSSNKLSDEALSAVGHILQNDGQLSLQKCSLTNIGLKRLKAALGEKRVKDLNLSNNKMSDEALSIVGHIIQNNSRLWLKKCSLTSLGLQHLKAAIADKKLKELNLDGNELRDEALSVVGDIVQNNCPLWLRKCSLTSSGLKNLEAALGEKKVTVLNLGGDKLLEEGLSAVGHIIQNDGYLRLQGCSLTNAGLEFLKAALGHKKVKKLNLSNTKLSDEALSTVGQIIQNNGQIKMVRCELRSSGLECLKTALGDKKVTKLNVSNNMLSDEAISAISHFIQNDGQLKCSLTDAGHENLKTTLGDKKVNLLVRDHKKLSDEALSDVMHYIETHGQLDLREYSMTSSGFERLKTTLGDKKVRTIMIHNNKLSIEALTVVGHIIQNGGELYLQRCQLTCRGWERLKTALGDKKMSRLDISGNTIDSEIASTIGKITKDLSVDKLVMMKCSLTDTALNNFLSEATGCKLSYFDVSDNSLSQGVATRIRRSISVGEINSNFQENERTNEMKCQD